MNTTLYRLYDRDGTLLYVGVALAPFARLAQHRAEKRWWADVVRIELANFDTRDAALLAETAAIRSECPFFNVVNQRPCVSRRERTDPYPDIDPIELDDDLNPVVEVD